MRDPLGEREHVAHGFAAGDQVAHHGVGLALGRHPKWKSNRIPGWTPRRLRDPSYSGIRVVRFVKAKRAMEQVQHLPPGPARSACIPAAQTGRKVTEIDRTA